MLAYLRARLFQMLFLNALSRLKELLCIDYILYRISNFFDVKTPALSLNVLFFVIVIPLHHMLWLFIIVFIIIKSSSFFIGALFSCLIFRVVFFAEQKFGYSDQHLLSGLDSMVEFILETEAIMV